MIICGIDPGTAIVGWGVIDTGVRHDVSKTVSLGYGAIVTDKGLSDSKRLLAIANGLEALFKQYTPDLVSVEKLFFSNNQKTAMTVSQARGVIILVAEQQGLKMVDFTPMQVKQALTGYGKADKKQMQQMAKLLLHLSEIPKPDDAADALAIALAAAQNQTYA